MGTIRPDEQQAAARYQIDKAAEREHDCVDVAVDVRMVELDIVDDRHVRQILQELGRLIEKRAVILVSLDDELASAAEAVARTAVAEVRRDAADEHARINAAMGQQPARNGAGGGLAVRAGNNNRSRAPEEM